MARTKIAGCAGKMVVTQCLWDKKMWLILNEGVLSQPEKFFTILKEYHVLISKKEEM